MLVSTKDVAGLQDFMSDAFLVQRADGSYIADKQSYIANLPVFTQYEVTNVVAHQDGRTLIVRHETRVQNQLIDGVPFASAPSPRLSIFVWNDGRWQALGLANFNVPAAQ
jgi:hypothetical protein